MIWGTTWLFALYLMVPLGMAFGSFVEQFMHAL